MHDSSAAFCPNPCGPVWAASTPHDRPQTQHGCRRTKRKYSGLREGFIGPPRLSRGALPPPTMERANPSSFYLSRRFHSQLRTDLTFRRQLLVAVLTEQTLITGCCVKQSRFRRFRSVELKQIGEFP